MTRPALICALVSSAATLWPWLGRPALGQDLPPISYSTNSPLLVGSEPPRLEIRSSEQLDEVGLVLTRGRERSRFDLGTIGGGDPTRVELDAPPGSSAYAAELTGTWQGAPFELTFEFDFEVTEGLSVLVPLEQVDLAGHALTMVLDRPADRVTYQVIGDDGSPLGGGEVSFGGLPAGTDLRVPWEQAEGTVLRIDLRAYATDGFWAEVELIPWSLDIPHEEVNFASGSDVIDPIEEPKIDAAYGLLQEAVARYGDLVEIQLYVAGYTDTVGSAGDNQGLSERRARSIGRAFRQRGFGFPIFYQGFGESVLEVATPDSTDEARNRRALYVLAAQPPLPSVQIPQASWRPID